VLFKEYETLSTNCNWCAVLDPFAMAGVLVIVAFMPVRYLVTIYRIYQASK